MELKDLIALLRRWAWLLLLGLLLGLVGGYLASKYMEPVYEVNTKLMISREVQDVNPDFTGLNSQQLVQTYVQILRTKPLMETTAEKSGIAIDPDKISVEQLLDTQIIEIKIETNAPDDAVTYANIMVQVLMDQNEEMQTGQYNSLEDRLTRQVKQVEVQIDSLQTDYDQAYDADYQVQLEKVDEQVNSIQDELSTLQTEIDGLNPGYRQADRILMAEKQARVDQLQSMFVTYEQIRANLLILGRPLEYSNVEAAPRLQQLQSTLDLYQNMYLTLVEDLERVRLARIQQTPTIVQIEEAAVPQEPIRPIPLLYTAISGIVGAMLTLGLIFFMEALKSEPNPAEVAPYGGKAWQLESHDGTEFTEKPKAVENIPGKQMIKVTAEAKKPRRSRKAAS